MQEYYKEGDIETSFQQTDAIHFVGHFIIWHRYYLWAFEKALQTHCDYNGTIPYWNWVLDTESSLPMEEYPIFTGTHSFGGNGPWEPTPPDSWFPVPGRTGGGCVTDGAFTYPGFSLALGPVNDLSITNPHCLRRDFSPEVVSFNLNAPAVATVLDSPDFPTFARNLEGFPSFDIPTIHGGGHFGVGGTLGTLGADPYFSPGDPIFFQHHGNLDRLYWEWQKKDLPQRLNEVGGNIVAWDFANEVAGNVTLDFEVHLGELAGPKKVSELLDIQDGPFCYKFDTDA
jgi:tyrosinase